MNLLDYLFGQEEDGIPMMQESAPGKNTRYGEAESSYSGDKSGLMDMLRGLPEIAAMYEEEEEDEDEYLNNHTMPWQSENMSNRYFAEKLQGNYNNAKQVAPNIPDVDYSNILGVKPERSFMPTYRGR